MSSDQDFRKFINEVKDIERKDSVYTSKQQIERLLRPGSSYANLNPFEVLMVEFDDDLDRIKKQYKRLSILLHPDKNLDDKDRATQAFDAVNRAYKILEEEQSRNDALEIVEEAKFLVRKNMDEKRKKLKREGRSRYIDEDDPIKYRQALKVMTMKLFADYERKRRSDLERLAEERKRKHDDEEAEKEKKKDSEQWNKNFEESRESRITSWKNFQTNKKFKKSTFFKPPKPKVEGK